MDLITLTNLMILAILIVMTAFFVASEFAAVKMRMSRIEQLIDEGNKKAVLAKKVVGDLDYYLSACQLGITVTALGLGAIGKPAVERILYPVFDYFNVSESSASIASYAIAFLFVTFLHVVVGEMAPKTLAIQFSEKLTLLLSPPLYWFGKIMHPFIVALNGTSRVILRMFGVKPAGHEDHYSEEELRIIMAQSFEGGEINEQKLEYLENVFSFDERIAKDIMIPRTSMVALDYDMSNEDIVSILDINNYTRYPVIETGNKDRVLGVVNVKKMLPHIIAGRDPDLKEFVRSLPTVSSVTPIKEAMLKMQQEQMHMALVIDEYGGTAGILTLEDILEELVGEIRDEFDADEVSEIQRIDEQTYIISGRVLLEDIEEQFGLTFEDSEEIDTIGGWIQFREGTSVEAGYEFKAGGQNWTIMEIDNFQIKQVILHYKQPQLQQ
ncbi:MULTISPECIES: hemolysin family protein [unclassified Paenibacillus]|uniref:hemolysin family protein n=1 Tax=unclassified Paenibacillus TaxID=185978 RepID=UPI002404C6EA|nr:MULTISPECIES: hemolysin family protein [unclassified Paenibacillus]MDF9839363.1 CBS domain containing-hemolysin-like protein [Paenibacillus sp. PastF-2]MDF9845944.1 CBS domain containing-hemolysin-like protein [Paenibacillus sp. PastM-2]MDF9852517.1 CBS domain containing-hemolysin-like protein [Paenibacillus sp. PastF-1]MDH6477753.1 CBS domain containing-hemolysin-like protein [Paenibacillus sp. PastH-2]MDH6505492.1 CBS domain containing-hemolysin-like protein [Paenibacillus sp. PastM-3]